MNSLLLLGGLVSLFFCAAYQDLQTSSPPLAIDPTPQSVSLVGTYTCLPYEHPPVNPEDTCHFGLKTDSGDYYLVNFGASANAKALFDARAHVRAEGFVVPKEALNTDQWAPYRMKGIFTMTTPASQVY